MSPTNWHNSPVTLFGVDLAWGERNPDGVASIRFPEGAASAPEPPEIALVQGDSQLFEFIRERMKNDSVFVAIDAPTIGPNETGSRPADRECSRLFRKEEAGCHPVNRRLCQRPFRIAEALGSQGFQLTSDLSRGPRLLAEVYPHPAMIRFFGIAKTIKYKRGNVARRREEFSRYQGLTRRLVRNAFSDLPQSASVDVLLSESWNKGIEDQLDAFFSSLIGWWHLRHLGEKSQQLGEEETGTILLPNPSAPGVLEA